jgi:hypothetical protein
MDPVRVVKASVDGSKISALESAAPLMSYPPAERIFPLFKRVVVWDCLAAAMEPRALGVKVIWVVVDPAVMVPPPMVQAYVHPVCAGIEAV